MGSSSIINISLLVLIATLLTKITFVKQVMAEEIHAYRTMDQLILGGDLLAVFVFSPPAAAPCERRDSKYQGARALAAGPLGGPMVGMGSRGDGSGSPVPFTIRPIYSLAKAMSTLFEGRSAPLYG